MSICLAPARAAPSQRSGARSHGPTTVEGKARSVQNALKHGFRAQRFVVGDEDAAAFAALESALVEELAPDGALQGLLARRIARAAWRLERAERIEAEPWRALRLLTALQAEAPGPVLRDAAPCAIPNQPETPGNPGESESAAPADEPGAGGDAKMRRPVALLRHPASPTK